MSTSMLASSWRPMPGNYGLDFLGLTHFIGIQTLASTTDLEATVLHLAWFAMLDRLAFVCLDAIYEATDGLGDTRTVVTRVEFVEVPLFNALLPQLEADLTRP